MKRPIQFVGQASCLSFRSHYNPRVSSGNGTLENRFTDRLEAYPTRRSGLILLIVLGMLALFSLIAVTYVVFASQTRATSVGHTRRLVRETPTRPLLDDAIKQLVRGTNDPNSTMWGQDVLADLYGANETSRLAIEFGDFEVPTSMFDSQGSPLLLGNGRFLRIPIQSNPRSPSDTEPNFPGSQIDDLLTGRIITFNPGEGPLGGQSFRILRYIGDGTSAAVPHPGVNPLIDTASRYSITIDLQEADLNRSHSQIADGVAQSGTIVEWARKQTNGRPRGHYLCYANGDLTPRGYRFFLNAVPLNGHGVGIASDGSSQSLPIPGSTSGANADVALQPNAKMIRELGLLPSFDGDTDEPIDAADYNTMFLSYTDTDSGASQAEHVIPSFHRAALINYLVNFKDRTTWTEGDFWAALRRIELATLRPLSIDITSANPIPVFMGIGTGQTRYQTHPKFSVTTGGQGSSQEIPTLRMSIPLTWSSNLVTSDTNPNTNFAEWLLRLLGQEYSPSSGISSTSSWDVDNNNDGLADSIWMDIGLPLQRTADGKLLKALVAYYVEDLDGKLDINAAGGTAQAGLYGEGFSQGALGPEITARHSGVELPQGLGYGPADLSLGPIVSNDLGTYSKLLTERYRPRPGVDSWIPGADVWGAPSRLLHVQEYPRIPGTTQFSHRHSHLPGLPIGLRGRVSIALDRLGNPFIHNISDTIGIENNEYEARLIAGPYQDSPFTIDEWERIYRAADSDSAELPDRLRATLGIPTNELAGNPTVRGITPRSRHLRVPKLAVRAQGSLANPNPNMPDSFYKLVDTVRRLKHTGPEADYVPLSPAAYQALFPVEFHRSAPMNLNRPFGNGWDDNDNGEIDEPSELSVWTQRMLQATSSTSVEPDIYGVVTVHDGYDLRQHYARHLYCLAQLIVPAEYHFPNLDRFYWKGIVDARESDQNAMKRYLEIRARILAQWAVNVVDFRDADSVMTRFEYDPDPFDQLSTQFDPPNATPGWNWRRWNPAQPGPVAWGMEQPELLLTESLAFHDIRVRDGDSDPMKERFDQFRMPQGSLFLELYAPRTTSTHPDYQTRLPGLPSGLYQGLKLNLSKLSPPDGENNVFPVWRVYIGNPVDKTSGGADVPKTPNERLTASSATSTNDPTRFDLTFQLPESNLRVTDVAPPQNGLVFDYATTNTLVEPARDKARVLVFSSGFVPTTANTPGIDHASQVYFNRSGDVWLDGNQYVVIGPRETTFLGSRTEARSALTNKPNRHRIQLGAGWPEMFRPTAADPVNRNLSNPNVVRQAVTMIAAANVPQGGIWGNPPGGSPPTVTQIGINVSEPLPLNDATYYKRPTHRVNSNDNGTDIETNGTRGFGVNSEADGYYDHSGGSPPSNSETEPFDAKGATPLKLWWDRNYSYDDDGERQQLEIAQVGSDTPRDSIRPGTAVDWCTAYLQRLADPDRPWHKDLNPYITVDWIPIDLTVFSGEEDHDSLDPMDGHKLRLASRQKSGQMMRLDASTGSFDFEHNPNRAELGQSFLSSLTYAPREALPTTTSTFLKFEIPGETTIPRMEATKLGPENNDPERKFFSANTSFTTLGFLNSTFVLAAEPNPLSLDLPFIGAPRDPDNASQQWHPATIFWTNRPFVNSFELAYVPLSSPSQLGHEISATKPQGDQSRYLMPDESNASFPFTHLLNFYQPPASGQIGLAQLLDLVDTPSPWADVEAVQPRSMFYPGGDNLTDEERAARSILTPFRPPFNILSEHVEPGRINLNTISEESVFHGLIRDPSGNPGTTFSPSWNDFIRSRQGYAGASLNNDMPTQFAGAFKPVSEAGMIPTFRDSNNLPEQQNPVHTSLLRGGLDNDATVPLFRENTTNLQPHVFTDLHPISRLQKLTTDKSNVFAVYVTIGLFDYDQQNNHIGREYGLDNGRNKRFRAFYVIDRSIPVGYRVGEDHNTENTILVRRILSE